MSDHFGVADYIVLVVMLCISTGIGLYFAWKDRKNKNEEELFRGNKNMPTFPVSVSIMASFIPSTGLIGLAVVVYATGTQIWIIVVNLIISSIVSCQIFIPIYYKMNMISVNQYLLKRFQSKNLQIIANIATLISFVPFLAVEMFAPAIALSIVTDMSINASILTIGLIVTLYTSLGGLKGVIWTDLFQFLVMIFGMTAVVIRGANIAGGMTQAFKKAYTGGRVEFFNMEFDFYSMNSFWVYFFGFSTLWCGTFASSQMQIQRVICLPTLRSAQRALYSAVPGIILSFMLMLLSGVVMYAKYYDCEPLLTGRVTRPDQMLPYFVLDIFEDDYSGLPGAFVASIFASSLSTLSSGLNGMASIIWDDYAKKVLKWIPHKYSVTITKLLAAGIGFIALSLAFVIKRSQNIIEVSAGIYGSAIGPMFAIFCIGVFIPWGNKYGAGFGLILGELASFWITIGGVFDKRDPTTMSLPFSTDGCADKNITVYMKGAPISLLADYKIPKYYPEGIDVIHHISPYAVPFIGFMISFLIANLISLLTFGNRNRRVDNDLVNSTSFRYLQKLLPKDWHQFNHQRPDANRVAKNKDVFDVLRDRSKDCMAEFEDAEGIQFTVPLRSPEETTNI